MEILTRTKLRLPSRQVVPNVGQVRLRCGACGGMRFETHVKPINDRARVATLVCLTCLKTRKVDDFAVIESDGKIDVDGDRKYVDPIPYTREMK